ncbi:MAG: LytTR family DNA-binding domain-containing protein [Ginsengibacter sp.]
MTVFNRQNFPLSIHALIWLVLMRGLNGLQFVRSLINPPMIIFVTAYKEHTLERFELDAVDYLLKPVSFERFLKACNKAYDGFKQCQTQPAKEDQPGYFFVHVEYNQVKITIADILYIEGMKDYVKIFLASSPKPVITRMSMKALEERLATYRFLRVHKSYIVSADKVTAIKRDLICIGNNEWPQSETYKPAVEAAILL